MNLTIKNIFLILCIIDMSLCVVYWIFDLIEKLITKNLSRISSQYAAIDR